MGKRALIVAICIVLCGAGVLFMLTKSAQKPDSSVNAIAVNETASSTAVVESEAVPDGYEKYINEKYGFSILYPKILGQEIVDDREDSETVVFQNPEAEKGFQIYIAPFHDQQITEERFRQDIPSGVRTNTEAVTIDGASGVAFYSKDAALGETREVWFIHGGFLFEVTTLKPPEADLLDVLRSWRFIPESGS